jgi:hypothetical protein
VLIEDGSAPHRGVDDVVDATECCGRLIEQTLDVEVVGDVGAHGNRCAVSGEDLLDRGLRSPLVVEVHDHDRVTAVCEHARDLAAHPV